MEDRVSILANLPSRQTFGGFSSSYSTTTERAPLYERLKFDQFKLHGFGASKQRQALSRLVKQKNDLLQEGLVKDSQKVKKKWAKTKDRLPTTLDSNVFPPKKRTSTREKLSFFMNMNRKKQIKNQSYLLHLIKLYIRDQNQTAACKCFHILDLPAAIKYQVVILNLVFLMALNAGMDTLAILMMESHFPKSVNDPILIEKPNAHYPSYFLVAMALGNDNIIKYMVRRGASVNVSWFGVTPIIIACSLNNRGHSQLVKFLIENGSDPTIPLLYPQYHLLLRLKSKHYCDSLPTSSSEGLASSCLAMNMRTAPRLFAHASNSEPIRVSLYPLEFSSALLNLESVAILLSKLEGRNDVLKYHYPLIIQQDVDISIRLLKAGANMTQRTSSGSTPLHLAARVGNIELIAVYLYFGLPIDSTDFESWTPLHEAAYFGQHEAVKYLISQGANVHLQNQAGDTPVQVALKSGFATEEIMGFFEKSSSELESAFIERRMNIEQLIAEIGDNRLGDANLRRKSRFFNFRKSRFTVERASTPSSASTSHDRSGVAGASLVNFSPKTPPRVGFATTVATIPFSSSSSSSSSLPPGAALSSKTSSPIAIGPGSPGRRNRTASMGTEAKMMDSDSLAFAGYSPGSSPSSAPTEVGRRSHTRTLSNLVYGSHASSGRKAVSSSDLSQEGGDMAADAMAFQGATSSTSLNSLSSKRSSSFSFGSMSSFAKFFSLGKSKSSTSLNAKP